MFFFHFSMKWHQLTKFIEIVLSYSNLLYVSVTVWRYMFALLALCVFLFVAVRVYTESNQVYLPTAKDGTPRSATSELAPTHPNTSEEISLYANRTPRGKYSHIIIIYAKQRTGSSFISEIFNHHPDVFYAFEPLNAADWTANFYNGSADDILGSVFNCNIKHLDRSANTEKRKNWVRAEMFCHLQGQNPAACQFRSTSPQHWASILTSNCKKRTFVAAKLIMLPRLQLLEPYISEGARVVVAVRDPRGVITSRMKIRNSQSASAAHDLALEYCLPLLTDLSYLRQVKQRFPKQTEDVFWLLRYEDMASNTVKVSKQILEFFGLRLDSRVHRWALGVEAGSPVTSEMTYSTRRKNSTLTSQGWKLDASITPGTISAIEDGCRPLMKAMGYRLVNPHQNHVPAKPDPLKNYVDSFDKEAFYSSHEPLLP